MSPISNVLRGFEFWRRVILVVSIIAGIMVAFYRVPALLTVTWIDFAGKQKGELESPYGYVSDESKILASLPLDAYIQEKTQGKVITLEDSGWQIFFNEIYLASTGQLDQSQYGNRLSSQDRDWAELQFENLKNSFPVFFKVDELPFAQWRLQERDGDFTYLSINDQGQERFLMVKYHDYTNVAGPMDSIYPDPPNRLFYPYRLWGWSILAAGILIAFLMPRVKKTGNIIEYPRWRMVISDFGGLLLFLLFFGLPFLLNGGTVQALSGWWGLSVFFWLLAVGPVLIFYSSAVYSAFEVWLGEDTFSITKANSYRLYRYDDVERVVQLALRNPRWFRRLFFVVLALSFLSGKGSPGAAGTYLLSESAQYTGLTLYFKDGNKQDIWFTDAMGTILLPGYEKIIEAMQEHGVPFNISSEIVEKFLPLP